MHVRIPLYRVRCRKIQENRRKRIVEQAKKEEKNTFYDAQEDI